MKAGILVLLLSLFLIPVGRFLAHQSPDPKKANIIAHARFKGLTSVELDEILSKARSGEAEAQYWVCVPYAEGTVPKNLEQGRRWLLKSAEQGYAPAQRLYGLMSAHANYPRWTIGANLARILNAGGQMK
jgi:TPR repeat protein